MKTERDLASNLTGMLGRQLVGVLRALASLGSAAVVTVVLPASAGAHPHVFVDAQARMHFDQGGNLVSVENIWKFDAAFSQYALQGMDTNEDGAYTKDELAPLAEINVTSLKDFEFFSYLTIGENRMALLPPTKYWLEYQGDRLTLFYTLPVEQPQPIRQHAMLEIFDREYFVEFGFPKENSVVLDGAPDCSARHHPPESIDPATMAVLGSLPQEQRELPSDLVQAVSALANYFAITCR